MNLFLSFLLDSRMNGCHQWCSKMSCIHLDKCYCCIGAIQFWQRRPAWWVLKRRNYLWFLWWWWLLKQPSGPRSQQVRLSDCQLVASCRWMWVRMSAPVHIIVCDDSGSLAVTCANENRWIKSTLDWLQRLQRTSKPKSIKLKIRIAVKSALTRRVKTNECPTFQTQFAKYLEYYVGSIYLWLHIFMLLCVGLLHKPQWNALIFVVVT